MRTTDATLVLEDGTEFAGAVPSSQSKAVRGEVVFTTGMTGYVESLTDPSYKGQILVFTYPQVGNYGVPPPDSWESGGIRVAGVVVNELFSESFHYKSTDSLFARLSRERVPVMTGVDTRAVTRRLRSRGVVSGSIVPKGAPPSDSDRMREKVSDESDEVVWYGEEGPLIVLVDYGVKRSIVRSLLHFPVRVKKVPRGYDYTDEDCDGVLLSNGPGDPAKHQEDVALLRRAMEKHPTRPFFGICLGAQLMALASGAVTKKLRYGHRGQNQPCLRIADNACFLTSQNHGYVVEEASLSDEWEVTFRNIHDGSVEGFAHKGRPFCRGVQFHPEATPGPVDTWWLFEEFYRALSGAYPDGRPEGIALARPSPRRRVASCP